MGLRVRRNFLRWVSGCGGTSSGGSAGAEEVPPVGRRGRWKLFRHLRRFGGRPSARPADAVEVPPTGQRAALSPNATRPVAYSHSESLTWGPSMAASKKSKVKPAVRGSRTEKRARTDAPPPAQDDSCVVDPKGYGAAFDGQVRFLKSSAQMLRTYAAALEGYFSHFPKGQLLGDPARETHALIMRLAVELSDRADRVREAEQHFDRVAALFD